MICMELGKSQGRQPRQQGLTDAVRDSTDPYIGAFVNGESPSALLPIHSYRSGPPNMAED